MGTFRHHPDGWIFINDVTIPLVEFMIEEPGYALPATSVAREYDGVKDTAYTADYALGFDSGEEVVLDGYIAKLVVYQTNIKARGDSVLDSDYASDLATAKTLRKKASKQEAAELFNAYRLTDLELTTIQLNTYKASLIAQKTTVVAEIDALSNIKAVREYQYTGWPQLA